MKTENSSQKLIDGIYSSPQKFNISKEDSKSVKSLKINFKPLIYCLLGIIFLSFWTISGIKIFSKLKNQFQAQVAGAKDEQHKYLILFQNPAEIRATGGFIGNLGVLTLSGSKIEDLHINDIYALKWEFLEGREPEIPADIPLSFFKEKLKIQEANWMADFPTTAQKIENVYQKYSGPQVQGVIAIDPKPVVDILEILGPIKMPAYNLVLDNDNFKELIEYNVEVDNSFKRGDHTQNPKQILVDFTPLFLEKIQKASPWQKFRIYQIIWRNLKEKHLILYSNSSSQQYLISQMDISGELKNAPQDFLSVINTNISGQKSSDKISETILLSVNIDSSGLIEDQVKITHRNLSQGGFLERYDDSFIQIIVPQKTNLISFEDREKKANRSDIKIFSMLNKYFFSYKSFQVLPQEEKSISFQYQLPDNILQNKKYSLLVQKQPGAQASNLILEINFPQNLTIADISEKNLKISNNIIIWKTNLNQDRQLSIDFK